MKRHTSSIEKMKKAYILAKECHWKGFLEFFRVNEDLLDKHIDFHESTPFHYAAHSDRPKMYDEMLKMVGVPEETLRVLTMKDDMGNTPFHEVAFTGNVEMARSILTYKDAGQVQFKQLLELKNKFGETPVYRAAALGKTDLIKYFVEEYGVELRHHFQRTMNKMSILHAAVIDQFFGTALWLLKRYDELAHLTEDNNLTALQLLANMPSGFKSQTQMGTFQNFIYLLLPDYRDYNYYFQNKDETRKGGDLERGEESINHRKLSAFSWMWHTMWHALAKEWKKAEKLWRKKEMHNLAWELVYLLAEKDHSWQVKPIPRDRTMWKVTSLRVVDKPERNQQKKQEIASKYNIHSPILMTACNGITEIVKAMIHFHPQSIEEVIEEEHNILYMAVKHRQLEIFRMLKKLKMARSLAEKIDKESNTVLHCTADFHGGSQPGYALQLQEELHWFEDIKESE